MLAAAQQIKAINANIHIGYYLNSALDWRQYRLHHTFMSHPEWWLRNAQGSVIELDGDRHFANHTDLLNFDFSKSDFATFWEQSCTKMVDTTYFESCTIDRVWAWSENYKGNNTLSPQTITTFNSTKRKTLINIQRHLNETKHGGPLYINNGFHIPGFHALFVILLLSRMLVR